jgi:septal ring factor EnvC (AmiA/AmiB activator)
MIDDMVKLLKKEGQDDQDKKEYCEMQFDDTEDQKKALDRTLADTETAIDSAKEGLSALAEDIPVVEKDIKELDKQVAEATAIRKEESEEYEAEKQASSAAKQLLGFAKNRLNKFYNPKLYKPPAKEELSSGDAISRDMSFVQVSMRSQIEPPPETWDAYSKKSEESTGVIQMIDLLIQDLDKDLTESAAEEENAQKEYDETIAESKKDRVSLSKSLKEKSAAKADLEEELETLKATKKSKSTELMALEKVISDLHGECDWLLKYFDMRANAREGEIDALGKAKAVLSGADYSLLQTRAFNLRRAL